MSDNELFYRCENSIKKVAEDTPEITHAVYW